MPLSPAAGAPSAARSAAPVWVFGYGSLIWRPDFPHRSRRPAELAGYHRAFCRYSLHHRGTPERPGLVIGLREGGHCVGMAYQVHPADEAAALAYLDEREGDGYLRRHLSVRLLPPTGAEGAGLSGETVRAWVYIPNPEHASFFGQHGTQRLVELVATGRGVSGTALDYLRDLIAHLAELGVAEPELTQVLQAAEHRAAAGGAARDQ